MPTNSRSGTGRDLTREQKSLVAAEVIRAAGTLIEFWDERFQGDVPCTAAEAAEQISRWLSRLPGDAWDTRLDIRPQGQGSRET